MSRKETARLGFVLSAPILLEREKTKKQGVDTRPGVGKKNRVTVERGGPFFESTSRPMNLLGRRAARKEKDWPISGHSKKGRKGKYEAVQGGPLSLSKKESRVTLTSGSLEGRMPFPSGLGKKGTFAVITGERKKDQVAQGLGGGNSLGSALHLEKEAPSLGGYLSHERRGKAEEGSRPVGRGSPYYAGKGINKWNKLNQPGVAS